MSQVLWLPLMLMPVCTLDDDSDLGERVPTYVVLTGDDSRIEKPLYALVTSHEEWHSLWQRHIGDGAYENGAEQAVKTPSVDFKTCSVLAIFHGKRINAWGIRLLGAFDAPHNDTIHVQYERASFQSDAVGPPDSVTTFAFVVVPKVTKPVLFQESTGALKDGRRTWKTRATLTLQERRFEPEVRERDRPRPPLPIRPPVAGRAGGGR